MMVSLSWPSFPLVVYTYYRYTYSYCIIDIVVVVAIESRFPCFVYIIFRLFFHNYYVVILLFLQHNIEQAKRVLIDRLIQCLEKDECGKSEQKEDNNCV